MSKVKVAIAEDNTSLRELIWSIVKTDKELDAVGKVSDGLSCYNLIREENPDVVLMDIVMPRMDGLMVMDKVKNDVSIERKPKFIVISGVDNPGVVNEAKSLGAVYVLSKPFDNKVLLQKIKDAKNGREDDREDTNDEFECAFGMESVICDILKHFGINTNYKGYIYLQYAVNAVAEDQRKLQGITKNLYHEIAEAYGTTGDRVEKAMRHAITRAWEKNNHSHFAEEFDYMGGDDRPTCSEFIALVAEKVRIKYNR